MLGGFQGELRCRSASATWWTDGSTRLSLSNQQGRTFFLSWSFCPYGAPWALGSAMTVEDLGAGLETEVRDGVSGLRGKGRALVSGDA